MPCCPAVIDLWCEKPVTFPVISETRNNLSTAFLIRDNLIKLISDQGLSVELALLDGLYILLELHKTSRSPMHIYRNIFPTRRLMN